MKTVKLIATKNFRYSTRRLSAGDLFEANPGDARLLLAIKKARAADERPREPLAPPPASLSHAVLQANVLGSTDVLTFRGAPLPPNPHDRDGRSGGSVAAPVAEDLPALRAEYLTVVGRRPFGGWSADLLREKMAAHQADQSNA